MLNVANLIMHGVIPARQTVCSQVRESSQRPLVITIADNRKPHFGIRGIYANKIPISWRWKAIGEVAPPHDYRTGKQARLS